ncbi:M48 family metallopeptidase [Reinekea thalattae]|uniref:M48 family metalloprotease n=1 Tax=Reinekea thalattae TaxID=2593301 RepID=A0A5C8ZAU7_9GAMM|nr:M48 family metalloprotease [Reinekea thalattae]TXR54016.1 M48 family metalloprotease [Reinekea thalattae]
MRNIIQLTLGLLCIVLLQTALAEVGEESIDWTDANQEQFQDYAVRSLNRRDALLNEYWPHYWLNQRYLELNLANSRPLSDVIVVNLKSSAVNAFAMPGNLIGMHQGLWNFADSEDEFLSVLAHEMSHISLNHFSRLSNNQTEQGWLTTSGILLAVILSQQNADLASATFLSSLAAANQNSLTFSQAMELEADQFGHQLLEKSQYDAQAARSFFQRLSSEPLSGETYEFLRTHPYGSTRASRLSNEASDQSTYADDEVTAFDVIKFLFMDSAANSQQDNPFLDRQSQDQTNDPNVLMGWLEYNYRETGDRDNYIEQLSGLIADYRGFLPAYFRRLELMSQQNTNKQQQCAAYQEFNRLIRNQKVTLDVIRTMAQLAERCQAEQQPEWHVQLLWQSGQEQQAIGYLKRIIGQEQNTNLLASRRALLETLEQSAQRFR